MWVGIRNLPSYKLLSEIGNLNKLTYHLPLKSKRNLFNRLIYFQMRIILIRKLISS